MTISRPLSLHPYRRVAGEGCAAKAEGAGAVDPNFEGSAQPLEPSWKVHNGVLGRSAGHLGCSSSAAGVDEDFHGVADPASVQIELDAALQ